MKPSPLKLHLSILFFCFLLLGSLLSSAQTSSFPKGDTNKYRINLPSYWKPGNKVWRILDDKLPTVCTELTNKDLCGDDCMAMYTVDFSMSEPMVIDHYSQRISGNVHEIVTVYTFECSLLLRDRAGKLHTRIILADTNEVFNLKNRVTLKDYLPAAPDKLYLRKISSSEAVLVIGNGLPGYSNPGTPGTTSYDYINANKEKLRPQERDLYREIDKKFHLLAH